MSNKKYKAKLTADFKYTNVHGEKEFKILSITFVTKPLKKRPTQAFFKSCVKQASKDDIFLKDLHNLDGIETADGLEAFAYNLLQKKRTVTNFSFMYIEEY